MKGSHKEDGDSDEEEHFEGPRKSVCPYCQKMHLGIPTNREIREMRKMAQLKMLRARKAFYWRQLQRGMISKNGALFLVACVENALAREKMNIDMNEIKALWTEKYFFKFYKYCFKRLATGRDVMVADVTRRWRIWLFVIASRKAFATYYYVIIVMQSVLIIIEFMLRGLEYLCWWCILLKVFNFIFTVIYGLEIFIKILIPIVKQFFYSSIQEYVSEAFEITHNFVWVEEQMIALLDFIVTYEELNKELWAESDIVRFDMVRLLASTQKRTPSCEIDLKTTLAIHCTLKYLKQYVKDLKEVEGLLDTQEYMSLINQIEERFRGTRNFIKKDKMENISSIVSSIPWIAGNENLACFIEDHGIMLKYKKGDQINVPKQFSFKIYIMISGTFEVHFRPADCYGDARVPPGRLPIVDHLIDFDWKQIPRLGRYKEFVEIVSLAGVIGELSFLTGRQYNSTVACDTALEVLSISAYELKDGIEKFPSEATGLVTLMWKTVAARFIPYILAKMPMYQDLTLDAIVWLVARALVVTLRGTKALVVTGVVKEVVLLEGQVRDKEGNPYFGPSCLPHITEVTPADIEDIDSCQLLVIPEENAGECYILDEGNQVKVEPLVLSACPLHAMKTRHSVKEGFRQDIRRVKSWQKT
ncbi:sodium/hydrogen exchanger 11-like [Bacillus rossius redtenbacheri]|uniref:sodium/hydrogen exchanger 11-like n=1 Tax=Bacillus rossius redtenbacheri TaxID=93214 RepID=UPI002FDED043